MGLDQYAYATGKDINLAGPIADIWPEMHLDNYGGQKEEDPVKLEQWRKHADLQGWMAQLFEERISDESAVSRVADEEGNPIEVDLLSGLDYFNCAYVQLFEEDIDRLEEATLNRSLPKTTGFYFGESGDYHHDQTLEFCRKARSSLSAGAKVFYYGWY